MEWPIQNKTNDSLSNKLYVIFESLSYMLMHMALSKWYNTDIGGGTTNIESVNNKQ